MWTGKHSNFARNTDNILQKGVGKQHPRHWEVGKQEGDVLHLWSALLGNKLAIVLI